MTRIPKQEPIAEQEPAIKRVKNGQRVGLLAEETGPVEQTPRNGVKGFEARTLEAPGAPKVTPEAKDLWGLHARSVRLKRGVQIARGAHERANHQRQCADRENIAGDRRRDEMNRAREARGRAGCGEQRSRRPWCGQQRERRKNKSQGLRYGGLIAIPRRFAGVKRWPHGKDREPVGEVLPM